MSTQSVILPALSLWYREFIRFYRQRDRVVGTLATPLVFWIVIGSGFGASFSSNKSYLEYLFPGTIILSILFTAIFSTITVIEDRREGFLQSVLVAPVPRYVMILGKILGASGIAVLQGGVFLLLAPWIGIKLTIVSYAFCILVLAVISFGLASLGLVIAWRSSSTQGFHAIMNLFLMPMWFLSGAFFPGEGVPAWMQWVIRLNPLTYGVRAFRMCLEGSTPFHSSMLIAVISAFLIFLLAAFSVRRTGERDLP